MRQKRTRSTGKGGGRRWRWRRKGRWGRGKGGEGEGEGRRREEGEGGGEEEGRGEEEIASAFTLEYSAAFCSKTPPPREEPSAEPTPPIKNTNFIVSASCVFSMSV